MTFAFNGPSFTNILSLVFQLFCSSGTGLTMYAAVIWSFVFNVSLDGMSPTTHEFDGVLGCCNDAIQPVYNFAFYNIQSLSPDSHSIRISLLNSTSGARPPNVEDNVSVLLLDYAVINTTVDTSSTSPPSTNSSQNSQYSQYVLKT
jgi:hypothetical protein